MDLVTMAKEMRDPADEVRDRWRWVGDAESRVELGAADDERDTRGEADDDWVGDVADVFPETQGAESHEHHAGHYCGEGESDIAVGDDRRGADADEGSRGAGDLRARASEQGDDHAADDGRIEALFGADAGSDGQSDGEG